MLTIFFLGQIAIFVRVTFIMLQSLSSQQFCSQVMGRSTWW